MEYTKPTQGVMINIPEDIKQFIGTDESTFASEYADTYIKIAPVIEKLAHLEELIIQQRCIRDCRSKIKLSILREYVYARAPFYRKGKSTKDIRVIVSRIDLIYPNKIPTLDELSADDDFMDTAVYKLSEAMSDEHVNNFKKFRERMSEVENF